ncbi:hypothetical protein CCB80_00575 [Armatimonadetes bacterium Uphvl-Ar1]|nr:hypothetical protein CCB80_00575 [Armatimonadetes bacterium Uphvl-Ar1]
MFAAAAAILVPTFLLLNSNSKASDHVKAYHESNLPKIPLKQSLPKVIHFSKSASLQLIAYSGAKKLTTGKWTCIWGTISADGLYRFPDQYPPVDSTPSHSPTILERNRP